MDEADKTAREACERLGGRHRDDGSHVLMCARPPRPPCAVCAALRAADASGCERGKREERERYRYALSYAESNLTCGDDASENGHGGMWCFTRAALDKDGDPCECTNCRAWRAVCGVIDSAKAGLDAREGDP